MNFAIGSFTFWTKITLERKPGTIRNAVIQIPLLDNCQRGEIKEEKIAVIFALEYIFSIVDVLINFLPLLKRVRFSTSVLFSLSIGVELLTPVFPNHFLLLATIANIAKQICLACYLATGVSFLASTLCSVLSFFVICCHD